MEPIRGLVAVVQREYGFMADSISMTLYTNNIMDPEHVSVVEQITMKTIGRHMAIAPDLKPLYLSTDGAQRLMDSLWQVGIRPSSEAGISRDTQTALNALIGAKDEHIKDLRAIVANRLALEVP
jgi:NAD-specific glutamate dehydrogenase